MSEFGEGMLGLRSKFAVALGDGDDVSILNQPALDRLQAVATAGIHKQKHEVSDICDMPFALADADGFDEDEVISRSLAQPHCGAQEFCALRNLFP